MAEGIATALYADTHTFFSAGTKPSHVHPIAIAVMAEIGIDISGNRSKSVTEFEGQVFDSIVTVCDDADQNCPYFHGPARRVHWGFDDPALATGTPDEILHFFRSVRDAIYDKFLKDGRRL